MATITKKQLALLLGHVTPNRSALEQMRWMDNNTIVEFTSASFTYNNAEFTINSNDNHKIWYSQIFNFGINDRLELGFCYLTLKNGKEIQLTPNEIDVDTFWEYVKNKRFLVNVPEGIMFVFNKKSNVWSEKSIRTYADAHEYVVKCVQDGRYSDIGDLIKPGSIYMLTEI